MFLSQGKGKTAVDTIHIIIFVMGNLTPFHSGILISKSKLVCKLYPDVWRDFQKGIWDKTRIFQQIITRGSLCFGSDNPQNH